MGQKRKRNGLKDFNGFTVTMEMLALADPESIFALFTVHPNEEVTQEVLDSSHSRKQAENRMHSASSLLLSNEGV